MSHTWRTSKEKLLLSRGEPTHASASHLRDRKKTKQSCMYSCTNIVLHVTSSHCMDGISQDEEAHAFGRSSRRYATLPFLSSPIVLTFSPLASNLLLHTHSMSPLFDPPLPAFSSFFELVSPRCLTDRMRLPRSENRNERTWWGLQQRLARIRTHATVVGTKDIDRARRARHLVAMRRCTVVVESSRVG
jgi:hypothetical protein